MRVHLVLDACIYLLHTASNILCVKLKEGAVRKGELVKISYVCMEEADSKIFDFMVN